MSALMGPGGPQQTPIEPAQQPDPAKKQPAEQSRPLQIAQQIIDSAPPEMRSAIERIREVGKSIMFSPDTHALVLKAYREMPAGDDSDRLAKSIAALMSMVKEKSKGPFPLDAAIPAATVLLMDLADFVGQSGELEVTDELIAESTRELTGYMMQKMNITPEQIQAAKEGREVAPQPTEAPPSPQSQAPQGLMRGPQ